MTHKSSSPQEEAARLLAALQPAGELSCDEAREQIPALVEAELAGVDVDNAPEFAALLEHLDSCAECMELYAQLAEDLASMTGDAARLPEVDLTPPPLLVAARQSQGTVLRVLNGLKRRFELTLTLPSLLPEGAVLGGGKRTSLFADTLPEVAGAPLVSVSLLAEGDTAEVLVAVTEPSARNRWQILLAAGDYRRVAATDEHGVARFDGLPVGDVQDVMVSCTADT